MLAKIGKPYKTAAKQFSNNPITHPTTDNLKPSCQCSFIDCIVLTTPTAINNIRTELSIITFNLVNKRTNPKFMIPNIIQPFHCGVGILFFSSILLITSLVH